jgi:hypothetical protein
MTSLPSPIQQARELAGQLRAAAESASTAPADEVLLFLYRLRDGYEIVRSSSRFVSGRRFTVLGDLIYALESNPDHALRSPERLSFVLGLLTDIAERRILIRPLS